MRKRYPTRPLTEPLPFEPRPAGTFRLYRMRADEIICLCEDAPDASSMGVALATLYDDGEFDQVDDCVGIKRERGIDEKTGEQLPGEWLANPWNLGRRRQR